jgi:D-glycero-D-manno-heptose 1,7-bisphosphate phosphatase
LRFSKVEESPHIHCYDYPVTDSASKHLPRDLSTVFLDRDGVLNEKMPEGSYVMSWDSFHVLAGVPEAIARLNRAGLRVIVVSNQRGIALGLYSSADVEAIHLAFRQLLSNHGAHIDAFFICPHDHGQCNCRKPLPGLFEQAAVQFPTISAATSVMIGDSPADIEFGRRLGIATILINSNSEHAAPGTEFARESADLQFPSLCEAVSALLERS